VVNGRFGHKVQVTTEGQLTFIRLCSAQQQPEPCSSEFGVLEEDIKWAASHFRNVIFDLINYKCL